MKKNLLITVLVLTMCLAFVSGCGKPAEVEVPVEENIINPLPVSVDINNLKDCTVAVSLKEGDAFKDDNGDLKMNVGVYVYDLYDMIDVAELEVGDTIMRLGEKVKINDLERLSTGLIHINGGEENGGFDLFSNDDTVYYEIGFNDVKSYYLLGEVTLPVSSEFVYKDESDFDVGVKEYTFEELISDISDEKYDFTPNNTSLIVKDGYVSVMQKHYMP